MLPRSFKQLKSREADGILRSLSEREFKHDFYSNDYLGISKLELTPIKETGGSTGSRLISGNSKEAITCENFLADFFQAESALVFNSGYDANVGLFSSIGLRNDIILYDKLIHASVRDGIRLSTAQSYSFEHNDLTALESKLQRHSSDKRSVFIAVESLYSMDGDFAPLDKIIALAKKYGALLIIDEAHSGGVIGPQGKGLCVEKNQHSSVFARVITFGKAYGTHGAVVLGSERLKNYLVNFARSFIYTTALPPKQYQLIREAVSRSQNDSLRSKLKENIHLFRQLNEKHIVISDRDSPIQIIMAESVRQLDQLCGALHEQNFGVKLIQAPTVPKGKDRIRICLHAFNTPEEIITLSAIINLHLAK